MSLVSVRDFEIRGLGAHEESESEEGCVGWFSLLRRGKGQVVCVKLVQESYTCCEDTSGNGASGGPSNFRRFLGG